MMTLVVAVASVIGIVAFFPLRSALSPWKAALIFIGLGIVQILCIRISILPEIANR
jgi:hypothetical protein